MEAPVGLFDQFRGSLQVDLSGMDIHVAHIGCQPWKPGINVLSVPIPGQQPINCKSVPEVMDAWTGVSGMMDTALLQQAPDRLRTYCCSALKEEALKGTKRAFWNLPSAI
jgi:hypothetical protein